MIAWKRRRLEHQRLRDELAKAALQGFCAHLTGPEQKSGEKGSQAHARAAYNYADAAIRARANQ